MVEELAERGQAELAIRLGVQLVTVPRRIRRLAGDGELAIVEHMRRVELHQALQALLVLLGGRLDELVPVTRDEHAGHHHALEALIHRVANLLLLGEDGGERVALMLRQLEIRTQRPEPVADDDGGCLRKCC